ncbi:unnamed protein product [Brassica oleracea var. botrytis]
MARLCCSSRDSPFLCFSLLLLQRSYSMFNEIRWSLVGW